MNFNVLERRVFQSGEEIFSQGEQGDRAYFVQRGKVEIYQPSKEQVRVLGHITTGGIFGEMALLDGAPRMASARAVEDTLCVLIPKLVLEKKLASADPFVVALLRILLANVRASDG
jgi:CRP-like cAMP-binding protein